MIFTLILKNKIKIKKKKKKQEKYYYLNFLGCWELLSRFWESKESVTHTLWARLQYPNVVYFHNEMFEIHYNLQPCLKFFTDLSVTILLPRNLWVYNCIHPMCTQCSSNLHDVGKTQKKVAEKMKWWKPVQLNLSTMKLKWYPPGFNRVIRKVLQTGGTGFQFYPNWARNQKLGW